MKYSADAGAATQGNSNAAAAFERELGLYPANPHRFFVDPIAVDRHPVKDPRGARSTSGEDAAQFSENQCDIKRH
jgi:hypothetical protein